MIQNNLLYIIIIFIIGLIINITNPKKNLKEKKIKQMYTEYTYPKYNEEKMDKTAPIPSSSNPYLFIEQIKHYIYNGSKKKFNNYRVLDVGCGLGNELISISYSLTNFKNTEFVGIDLSPSSLKIFKQRLSKYNLENKIKLIEMSLFDLDPKIHGKFDLIICMGVLHHLEDPNLGLNVLKNVLKEDGFMNIMVYGRYGRTGVYQMQDLLKKINNNIKDFPTKIENYKNVYKQLPHNNWFKLGEHLIQDHKVSDEGIVDLLLHHQDRSYTVSELYEWINSNELNIVEFSPHNRYKYKYEINNIKYPNNIIHKYSINELFFGDIQKHMFYVSKKKNTKAKIDNLNNKLFLVLLVKGNLNKILNLYKINKVNKININSTLNYQISNKLIWHYDEKVVNISIDMNDIIYTILNNIDNKKTIKEIFDIVRKDLKIKTNNNDLLEIFKPIYKKFELYDLILLSK
jgi:SAM-dependent methyltransferase